MYSDVYERDEVPFNRYIGIALMAQKVKVWNPLSGMCGQGSMRTNGRREKESATVVKSTM